MKRTKIATILSQKLTSGKVSVCGWVRTRRDSSQVIFISINDGSTIDNLQVVADPNFLASDQLKRINTGAGVKVFGVLQPSQGIGQKIELILEKLTILGDADAKLYPLQPKKHSMEFLREIAHLRPRTSTMSAVFRIRHALNYAVHHFFNKKNFLCVHTPVITANDAEGAGDTFRVTTLNVKDTPKKEGGDVDFREDFFQKETNLTVSGQLEAELLALALGEVYTFGPTFRAENSNTSRHLSEFWMVEPEMAFYDLKETMDLGQEILKFLVQYVLDNCVGDLDFLNKRFVNEEKQKPQNFRSELSLIDRLRFVVENEFERISYTEAIEILKKSKPNKKKKFGYLVEEWGVDLQSEHERYLVEKHFKKPIIIFDYPKEIKSFYMRLNMDGKTVAAMDILFPGIGEIVGGSQREERMHILEERMNIMNVSAKELWWYLETRKFGTVKHSGFGLGFDRMIQFVCGMSNIRDVIPFPRTPGGCQF